jgi:transposase InsO family protein
MKYMYENQSTKLNYSRRLDIIKHYLRKTNKKKIAKKFNVSRQTVYVIIKKYLRNDVYGLEDHKPGILKQPINSNFYANIVDLRIKTSWGACKIEKYFNQKGFFVSHNKINQIIQYENLTRKKMGKQKRPTYVSYEADKLNDQWHIDWSFDPISKRNLLAIIDDKSRFIIFAGLFDNATGENSVIGLQKAINKYGAPKELVSDNGSHFKNIHTKKTVCEPLLKIEKKYAIKHIFIRAHYPQSNGKIERWFGSYKNEFKLMNHPQVYDLDTWVNFYNFERLHQSLGYETPAQIYLAVN